jgi:hypothetical protein
MAETFGSLGISLEKFTIVDINIKKVYNTLQVFGYLMTDMSIKQKLASPIKWFFAKKRRWIPVVIVLALIGGLFLVVDAWSPYGRIHHFISDTRYQISEKSRQKILKEEFKESKLTWESENLSDYEFKLKILLGGEIISEGSSGRSYGPQEERLLTIKVSNVSTISIVDNVTTKNTVLGASPYIGSMYENKYPYSIPELFDIIQEGLKNQDSDLDLLDSGENIAPRYISAEFSTQYGFPELIEIYVHGGNLESFHRFYLVTYEISELKIIE